MKKDFLKYLAGLLLFGSNGIIASHIALSSDEIVFLRSALGSLLLIALFLSTGHRFTAISHKKDLIYIAASGIAMAANWLFLFEAYQQIGVSLSIIVNYCGPAIAVVVSAALFHDKLTANKIIALLSALLGAILINGFADKVEINMTGLMCAVLAAFSCAAMIIFNKRSKNITGMENAVLQLLFTAFSVTIYAGCRGALKMEIPSDNWPWILWLALLNTGVGCYFYFSSISALPVQTVAVCGYLEPLSAVFFSVIFLHEAMLPIQWLGAALIIGGAVLSEFIKAPKVHDDVPE
jgi:drug/metabolite transporter (DMT)-like permease